jgi:hypothetical protein
MNSDKIVVYQTFTDPNEAHIVIGLLESYEIECFLSDENIVSLNTLYSNAVGGVKLNVFEKDVDRIKSILISENIPYGSNVSNDKELGEITCPKCHSNNVSYGGSIKRKFGIFEVFVAFLFTIYPFTMRKAYYCFECNHEFKQK